MLEDVDIALADVESVNPRLNPRDCTLNELYVLAGYFKNKEALRHMEGRALSGNPDFQSACVVYGLLSQDTEATTRYIKDLYKNPKASDEDMVYMYMEMENIQKNKDVFPDFKNSPKLEMFQIYHEALHGLQEAVKRTHPLEKYLDLITLDMNTKLSLDKKMFLPNRNNSR